MTNALQASFGYITNVLLRQSGRTAHAPRLHYGYINPGLVTLNVGAAAPGPTGIAEASRTSYGRNFSISAIQPQHLLYIRYALVVHPHCSLYIRKGEIFPQSNFGHAQNLTAEIFP